MAPCVLGCRYLGRLILRPAGSLDLEHWKQGHFWLLLLLLFFFNLLFICAYNVWVILPLPLAPSLFPLLAS
jgi:hypothetical protein